MLRPSTWLPLALLSLLVALTTWLNQLVQPSQPRREKPQGEPDLVVDRFSARKYGEAGQVLYTLAARRMEHHQGERFSRLQDLQLEAFEPKQPRVEVRSDSGRILEGGERVWFEGNVVMVRDADRKSEASTLRTDRLLVLPDTRIARSDDPVVLTSERGRLEAESAEANNLDRTLRMERVRATYLPKPRS